MYNYHKCMRQTKFTAVISLQDIDVALHRLPQDVVDARMQRLKRAVDCSLKKSYLSKELQDMQTPYAWYLKVYTNACPYKHGDHHSFCVLVTSQTVFARDAALLASHLADHIAVLSCHCHCSTAVAGTAHEWFLQLCYTKGSASELLFRLMYTAVLL